MNPSQLYRSTLLRLAALLVVSLLIHAALFGALPHIPIWQASEEAPIVASIEMPAPVTPAALQPVENAPLPHIARSIKRMDTLPDPVVKPSAVDPAPAAAAPVVASTSTVTATTAPNATSSSAAGTGTAAAASEASATAGDAPLGPPSPASALPVPPAPPAARPVDASLSYDVTALDPRKPDQSLIGHGTLSFHGDATTYRAMLEARVSLLFVSLTVLASESDGLIGADGLEPQRYSETPRNKPTSTATFAREANGTSQVSYSQGGDVAAAVPGTQDRLSVLLQVGALMQATPSLKVAGARFTIPVAGLKGNIEPWNFAVQGLEAVKLESGTQNGWHVSRILRPGSNDRGIEIWVGVDSPNIPLRVRYTEPSGATIDLVLASSN